MSVYGSPAIANDVGKLIIILMIKILIIMFLIVYIYNGSNINCYDLYQGGLLFIY